jgi:hypothetical protein
VEQGPAAIKNFLKNAVCRLCVVDGSETKRDKTQVAKNNENFDKKN